MFAHSSDKIHHRDNDNKKSVKIYGKWKMLVGGKC